MPTTARRTSTSVPEDDWLDTFMSGSADVVRRKIDTAEPSALDQYRSSFRDILGAEEEAAQTARQRQAEYDPYAAADRAAASQYRTFDRDLREGVEDLRGSQVERGRLRTGFGFEDEDRLYRGAYESLADAVAARSLQAAGLDLSNIQGMQVARQLAPELAAGGIDRELAIRDYEQQKKGGLLGGIGGLLGGAAGFIAGGGPLGAAVGANIGGNVFRGLFS